MAVLLPAMLAGCTRDFSLPGDASFLPELERVDPPAAYAGQTLVVEGRNLSEEQDPWLAYVGGKSRIVVDPSGRATTIVPEDVRDGPLEAVNVYGTSPPFFFDPEEKIGFDYLGLGRPRRGLVAQTFAATHNPSRLVVAAKTTTPALYIESRLVGSTTRLALDPREFGTSDTPQCGGDGRFFTIGSDPWIVRPAEIVAESNCSERFDAPAGYILVDARSSTEQTLVLAHGAQGLVVFDFDPQRTADPLRGPIASVSGSVTDWVVVGSGHLFVYDSQATGGCTVDYYDLSSPGGAPAPTCVVAPDCATDDETCIAGVEVRSLEGILLDGLPYVFVGTERGVVALFAAAAGANDAGAIASARIGVASPITSLRVDAEAADDVGGVRGTVVATIPQAHLVVGLNLLGKMMVPPESLQVDWSTEHVDAPAVLSNVSIEEDPADPMGPPLHTVWVGSRTSNRLVELVTRGRTQGRPRRYVALPAALGIDAPFPRRAMVRLESGGRRWIAMPEVRSGALVFVDTADPRNVLGWTLPHDGDTAPEVLGLFPAPSPTDAPLWVLLDTGLWALGGLEISPDEGHVDVQDFYPAVPLADVASGDIEVLAAIPETETRSAFLVRASDEPKILRIDGMGATEVQAFPETKPTGTVQPMLFEPYKGTLVTVAALEDSQSVAAALWPEDRSAPFELEVASPCEAPCLPVGATGAEGRLWIAWGWNPDGVGVGPVEAGEDWLGGLVAYDLATGEVVGRWAAPFEAGDLVLGATPRGLDLVWSASGDGADWLHLLTLPRDPADLPVDRFGVRLPGITIGLAFDASGERAFVALDGEKALAVVE